MIPEFLCHASFQFVKVSHLRSQAGISSRVAALLISQIPAMKSPGYLTPEAIILLFAMNPPWVIKNRQEYRLILANNLSSCIGMLSPETEIPVLVMPKQFKHTPEKFYQLQLQATFLQKIVFGLDLSTAGPAIIALWKELGGRERLALSSDLGTKSGFSRVTGVDRRLRPHAQTIVKSTFRQIDLLEGANGE